MNHLEFQEFKNGRLVPVGDGIIEKYAFVPKPLPTRWTPDASVITKLALARERLAELNGIAKLLDHPALLIRPLQRREAVDSTRMEGEKASPRELLLFELQDKVEPTNSHVYRNYLSLTEGYLAVKRGDKIDHSLWRLTHEKLMRTGRNQNAANPGQIRTGQNTIGTRFRPCPPDELWACIDNLDEYVDINEDHDPLIRAFIAHYQFECIHPFADGNGRIGRLLITLCVFKWFKHSLPWLYLSPYFAKNRTEYCERLYRVSCASEWNEWILFCLAGVVEECSSAIDKCTRFIAIKKAYEKLPLKGRTHGIVTGLFQMPYVSVHRLAKSMERDRRTVRKEIKSLVEIGVLAPVPDSKEVYEAKELTAIAFG